MSSNNLLPSAYTVTAGSSHCQTVEGLDVYQNVLNGRSVRLSETKGEIAVDTAWLDNQYVREISNGGVFKMYTLVNYDEISRTVAAFKLAKDADNKHLGYALLNVLTTGGLITQDHITPNSVILKQSKAMFGDIIDQDIVKPSDSLEDKLVSAFADSNAE